MKPPDLTVVREKVEQRIEHAARIGEGVLFKVHRQVYMRSGGRFGSKELGVPSLLLTTTGRTTGLARTVALVYAVDGEDLILAGSNGGSDRNPDWLENLRQHPTVEAQIARERFSATAEVVERNDRRYERSWRLVNAINRGRYYRYQQHTKRPIPVVLLTRTSALDE